MYKIIIADDNALTRQSFRASSLWESCGFTLSAEAENGVQALRLIREQKPDAAFLDIKMPGMTGLEVIRTLREEGVSCVFVVVSAYDDFTYAQQGVKLGVFDYLLKPVDDQELARVLHALRDRLDASGGTSAAERPGPEEAAASLERSSRTLKCRLLSEAVNGIRASAVQLEESLRQEWRYHGCELMLIAPDFLTKGGGSGETLDSFLREEERILRGCEKKLPVRLLEIWKKEGLLVLIVYQKVQMSREYDLTALQLGRWIFSENQENGRNVCIGISNFREKLERLPEAFDECIFAYDGRFFIDNKTVIHYGSMKSRSVRNEYQMGRRMQEIYTALRTHPEDLQQELESFFEMIREDYGYDAEYVKNLFVQTAMMMTCIAAEKNPSAQGMKDIDSILEEVRGINSIHEIFSWLSGYAGELVRLSQGETGERLSPVSRRAMDYLNQHYMEHLSLLDVAEAAGVSESHLCRSLKNDTGETFVNLLNKIRIQKAIRLLKEGDYKVYEIAGIVGFRNYAYFYQLFKRITGFPPTDFQQER